MVNYVHHVGVMEEMGTPRWLGRSEEGREKGAHLGGASLLIA